MIADPLLRCLRWDGEGEQRLRALSSQDWARLWTIVVASDGEGILARRLQATGARPPEAIAAELDQRLLVRAARNLRMRADLARAIGAASRPALLLKGVDLAERLYGNLGMRLMCDVDVLVRRDDVEYYDTQLRARGLRGWPGYDPRLLESATHYHMVYALEIGAIELHWRLGIGDETVDLDGIWNRAVPRPSFAPDSWAMAYDDLFLYLCLHLKHSDFGTPLTQLWDLAELISHPAISLDWATLRTRAREWRLENAVTLALHLLDAQLGIQIDRVRWPASLPADLALPDMLPRLGRHLAPDPLSYHRLATFLSSEARWTERLRALRNAVLPPRAEVRARHGKPGDGWWRDLISYGRRWRFLLEAKLPTVRRMIRDADDPNARFDRVVALRRYLYDREP